MRSSFLPALALAALSARATPVPRGFHPGPVISHAIGFIEQRLLDNDLAILKFADVLERTETAFYTTVGRMFNNGSDWTDIGGFVSAQVPLEQIARILNDESTHAVFLNATIAQLGGTPIPGCTFDFSALDGASTDTFIDTARVIELTGTGAYLGAVHSFNDPSLLSTAASIATVEARHNSILNALSDGTAIPAAFDVPLLPQEALSLAGGFIKGCSTGVTALPPLSVTNTQPLSPGSLLQLSSPILSSGSVNHYDSSLTCQVLLPGQPFSFPYPASGCTVPTEASGPIFVWLTNTTSAISGDVVIRGKKDNFSSLLTGPAIVFIDDHPEALGSIIRGMDATV